MGGRRREGEDGRAERRHAGDDGRAASRGRSGRFQTPRSAYLLKGISYTPISDSTNNDKSPKNNSLVSGACFAILMISSIICMLKSWQSLKGYCTKKILHKVHMYE
jgi:hypothetical protein